MNKKGATLGGLKVSYGAEHRSGNCEKCHLPFVKYVSHPPVPKIISYCPFCSGMTGELISNQFTRGRWFLYFLGNWDTKRVVYCEKHRTGLPQSFREGKFWPSFFYTIKLMLEGEWNGLQDM